jgi:hypothetical protein
VLPFAELRWLASAFVGVVKATSSGCGRRKRLLSRHLGSPFSSTKRKEKQSFYMRLNKKKIPLFSLYIFFLVLFVF